MEEMIITGERFIPEANDAELELEHFERYYSACQFVKDKVVLDAASGEGYGSYMLSQYAKTVTGVDLSQQAIDAAKNKYNDRDNLVYKQGSVGDLSYISSNSVDVVVSFETIEHVPEEVQSAFIKEIKRVLKADGLLIMSSPNKKEYTDRYDFHNEFHVHELYVDEFVNLLKTEFEYIDLYRQYLEVASFIDRADIDENYIQYHKKRELYNPEGKYVVALASNVELPETSFSIASLHTREEYLFTLDELNYCRGEAIKCRGIIKEHEKEIDDRGLENDKLKNDLKLANEELERRMDELNHRMNVINSLEKEKNQLNDEINSANLKIDEIKNDLKLANEELERRMDELNHRMDVINSLGREKNELNMQLETANGRLNEIESTIWYKLYRKIHK